MLPTMNQVERFIKNKRLFTFLFFLFFSCSYHNNKSRFLLAEKLWEEKNYRAAVSEFEKIAYQEEDTVLGQTAYYRAALTQSLFLNEHREAVKKLNKIIELKKNNAITTDALVLLGDIFYSKLEQYESAINTYRVLLIREGIKNIESYEFKIAKSLFYLGRFKESRQEFFKLLSNPETSEQTKEKALIEVARTYQIQGFEAETKGEASSQHFKAAADQYLSVLKKYPDSQQRVFIKFDLATCYEELERKDEATSLYLEIQKEHPNPILVESKIQKLSMAKEKHETGQKKK